MTKLKLSLAISATLIAAPVIAAEPVSRDTISGFTIEQAWQRTEAADPELAALASDLRILDARRDQAGRLANPEIGIMVENILGSGGYKGVDSAETTATIIQPIPLTRRLSRESDAAGADRELLLAEIARRKRIIAAQLAVTFVELMGHKEHVEHSSQAVELVERFARAAAERVKAGAAPAAEELRAETVLRDARIQLRRGELELEGSRYRLGLFWGASSPDFAEPSAEMTRLPGTLPPLEALISRLDAAAIDQVWEREQAVRERRRDLEKSRALPDMRLEAGVRRLNATNDNALVVGFSVPIPVMNRNQGQIREAEEQFARIPADRNAERKRLLNDLIMAYSDLRVHHEEAIALRDELLPKTRQALDLLLDGYRRGRFGLIDVTDVERRLYELLERYHDALVDFHQAAAVIESLIAEPLYPESITFISIGETRP